MAKKSKITKVELLQILLKLKGVTFSHIVAFTDEYGSRVVKGQRQLQKLTFRNITIGADYTNRVIRRIGEEFVSEEMSGKSFMEGCNHVAFANKNPQKTYLVCDQEKKAKVVTHFYHNGKKVSKEDAIAQNLFAPSYFAEKKTAGRGLVDAEDNFYRITIGIDNIIAITLNKVHYIIED